MTTDVMIVERDSNGHRLYYVRVLADAAARKNLRVTIVLSPSESSSPQATTHLAGLSRAVEVAECADLSLAGIEALSRSFGANLTVVPDGDWLISALARRSWRGAGDLSILVMREAAQGHSARAWLLTLAKRLLIAGVSRRRRVRVAILKSATWVGRSVARVARDPVTVSATKTEISAIKLEWRLRPDRYWFAILGAITDRKNVDLVAQSLLPLADVSGLVLAGRISPGVLEAADAQLQQYKKHGGSVVLVDRMLTDIELDSIVGAVDCIVLAHSNEGPSGLLGKAAASGTRLVGAGAKSLKRDIAGLPQLARWVPLNEKAITEALTQASTKPRPEAVTGLDGDNFSTALLS